MSDTARQATKIDPIRLDYLERQGNGITRDMYPISRTELRMLVEAYRRAPIPRDALVAKLSDIAERLDARSWTANDGVIGDIAAELRALLEQQAQP